jgi:hypothetical protein
MGAFHHHCAILIIAPLCPAQKDHIELLMLNPLCFSTE